MKKFIYILGISFFTCAEILAQDHLQKKDNTGLDVKILDITSTDVVYKPFNDSTAPEKTIGKKDLILIMREDGSLEPVSDKPPAPPGPDAADSLLRIARAAKKAGFNKIIKHKNTLFMNLLEPVNSCAGISYFREFSKTRLMVHLPLSFSFGKPMLTNQYNEATHKTYSGASDLSIDKKIFDLGFGLYVNTSDYTPVSFFIGPMITYSQYKGTHNAYIIDTGFGTASTPSSFTLGQTALFINNGVLLRVKPRLNIMLNVAVGSVIDDKYNHSGTDIDPNKISTTQYSNKGLSTLLLNLGAHIGFRF